MSKKTPILIFSLNNDKKYFFLSSALLTPIIIVIIEKANHVKVVFILFHCQAFISYKMNTPMLIHIADKAITNKTFLSKKHLITLQKLSLTLL